MEGQNRRSNAQRAACEFRTNKVLLFTLIVYLEEMGVGGGVIPPELDLF